MTRPVSHDVRRIQKLFLRHASRMQGFIYSLYPDRSATEDILHEVFLVLVEKAADFNPGSDFLAWARAVVRLKVLEARRDRRRAGIFLSEEVTGRLADLAEPFFEKWDMRQEALAKCRQRLSEKVQRMLDLRYGNECSLSTVAAEIGWSSGAVKVALSRARAALRRCIDSELVNGEV